MRISIIHKTFFYIASLTVLLSLPSCSDSLKVEDRISYSEVSPMPVAAANAACAVVGDVAYILGGRTPKGLIRTVYAYTPASDQWQEVMQAPFTARSGAVAVNSSGHIYVGLGFNGSVYNDSSYPRDWWRFTPATKEWKRLADYPSNRTAAASAIVHEDGIYIFFGFYNTFYEDVYRYDISSDKWEKMEVNSVGAQAETVAGEVNGRYFIGTVSKWYEYIPSTNSLEKRRSIGGYLHNLVSSSLFPYDASLYVVGGREWSTIGPDGRIFRYDPSSDKWFNEGYLPTESGKENMISFVVNGVPYIGLGEEKEKISAKMYKLTIK